MAFRLSPIAFALQLLTTGTLQPLHGSTNIALKKPASQSSEANSLGPTLAVDGNMDTSFSDCMYTLDEGVNWLTVDLLDQYMVDSVTVTNRGDCGTSCVQRLQNFTIEVTTGIPNIMPSFPQLVGTFCAYRESPVDKGGTLLLHCDRPVIGRYVRLVKFGFDSLTLCELEVFGRIYSPDASYRKKNHVTSLPGQVSYSDLRSLIECAYRCNSATDIVCINFQWNSDTFLCDLFDEDLSAQNLEPKSAFDFVDLYAKMV